MPKKSSIRLMFNDIAQDYDSLNHLLSLFVDKCWRRRAVKCALDGSSPTLVLDLACGTGDLSIALASKMRDGKVIGVDLSEGMLKIMGEKVKKAKLEGKISMRVGDGENLNFAEGYFDIVAIAFGLRNFEDKERGMREVFRVLKPGGRFVILELSRPGNPILRNFYDLYFLRILPFIGGRISGNRSAYKYLPGSVVHFPGPEEFLPMMQKAGFSNLTHKALSLGICRMYVGEKPL